MAQHVLMHPRRRRARRGFSLVELLVSMVVLSVGLVGAAQCLVVAMQCGQKSNRIALGTAIAQNAIEEVRSYGDLNGDDFDSTTTQGSTISGTLILHEPTLPSGKVVVTVADYNTALKLRSITTVVSWRGANAKMENLTLFSVMQIRQRHIGG